MIFIEIFYYLLVFVGGGLVSYYLLISVLALRSNMKIDYEAVKKRKFAVILFAQGEEQVLSRALYSLSGLVYPKNKYDLIVIADNYSDSIVQVAEKMGAKIIELPIDKRDENKNVILPWVFDSILQTSETYDAVTIFDSDGLVSGNYLKVMNDYLDQGSEVIQCSYKNFSNSESWIDKICEVNFMIDRFVYPMGRKVLGVGITLWSNGICFSTDLLREFPWRIGEQPSVIEYGLDLRLKGIEIDFASNAVVFKKVTASNRDLNSNSKNLNAGSYQLIREYMPQLLNTTAKTKSLKYIGILLELVSPQFANFMLFLVAAGVINSVFWAAGWISLSALLPWLIIIGVAIASIPVALRATGAQQKFLKSVLYLPITVYLKAQSFIQEYRREEQSRTVELKKKDERFVDSDKNQPVQ